MRDIASARHRGSAAGPRFDRVYLAANNGAIGGGEVMLLRIAQTLRDLGVDVTVVAPSPSTVAQAAEAAGLSTIGLPAANRVAWMRALRRWDRQHRTGLLWCNGLVPSVATTGRLGRVVHLHQLPQGSYRILARAAALGAVAAVVPSRALLPAMPGARVLPNWTEPFRAASPMRDPNAPIRVGFLGRTGIDKGVHVLACAMRSLQEQSPGQYRLELAGESLFVPEAEIARMEEMLQPIAAITHRAG